MGIVSISALPLKVSWAFHTYATGQRTLKLLAAELEFRGLITISTAKLPEKPLLVQSLDKLLRNTFYIGQVTCGGAIYQENHQPMISREVFRRHPTDVGWTRQRRTHSQKLYYLKSTIYRCIYGSQLITINATHQECDLQMLRLPGSPLQETTRLHLPRHPDRTD